VQEEEETREVGGGFAVRAIAPVLAVGFLGGAGGSAAAADLSSPGEAPAKSVTLGKGRLWGSPWELIAFHTKVGSVCEGIVRDSRRTVCSNVPVVPDPLLIPAIFTQSGPKPTTFALISVAPEIATVEMRLVPGGRHISRRVTPLSAHDSRRSGLPEGFRFVVVSVSKVRAIRSVRGLAADGHLVGRIPGSTPPH
jgi:hypothetical protein